MIREKASPGRKMKIITTAPVFLATLTASQDIFNPFALSGDLALSNNFNRPSKVQGTQAIDRLTQLILNTAVRKGLSQNDIFSEPVQTRSSGPIKPSLAALNYGCFCHSLGERETGPLNFSANLGTAKDQLDEICRGLINGWTCLRSSGVDVSSEYKVPDLMFTSINQANQDCENLNSGTGNENLANLCKVETKFTILYLGIAREVNLNDPSMAMGADERDTVCHPYKNRGTNTAPNPDKRVCCTKDDYPGKAVLWQDEGLCM